MTFTEWKRFWDKTEYDWDTGCSLWTGNVRSNGYGVVCVSGQRGEVVSAHRFIYEHCYGPIAEGLVIDHLCRVRNCVNPGHLEAVTTRENVLRGEGTAAKRAKQTHCVHGHEFTPENTHRKAARPNHRICKTCRREDNRRRRARKRQLIEGR